MYNAPSTNAITRSFRHESDTQIDAIQRRVVINEDWVKKLLFTP